jgi:hypothetical protein
MLKAIEGVYRRGRIELEEKPRDVRDDTRVIVTFLDDAASVDLALRGIDQEQASELRSRFSAFAEDWESPEMKTYDNYDAARAKLPAR